VPTRFIRRRKYTDRAEVARELNFRRKKVVKDWGMLSPLAYAVVIVRKGKLLAGDPHFKG
jgi:hypothetical protein